MVVQVAELLSSDETETWEDEPVPTGADYETWEGESDAVFWARYEQELLSKPEVMHGEPSTFLRRQNYLSDESEDSGDEGGGFIF